MNSCSTSSNDFDFIHSLISNRGEYELTMDGIHENMLQLHYHDPMMHKTVNCLNTLGVSDYLHQYIMRTQQMSLLAYQPSTAIAIRSLISQIEYPHIEWPKSFHRYRMLFADSYLSCVNSEATTVSFDPPIDEFISFKEYKSDHSGLNLAMKQVLVHEIEKQKFLRQSVGRCQPLNAGNNTAYQALPRQENGKVQTTSDGDAYAENNMKTTKDKQKGSTNLITSGASEGNIKVQLQSPRVAKKASAAASNFFNRQRKEQKCIV